MNEDFKWILRPEWKPSNLAILDCRGGSIATTESRPSTSEVTLESLLQARRELERLGPVGPLQMYIDDHLGWKSFQVRFPKSRKRRIRKKWFSQSRNWKRVQEPVGYLADLPDIGDLSGRRTIKTLIANEPFKQSIGRGNETKASIKRGGAMPMRSVFLAMPKTADALSKLYFSALAGEVQKKAKEGEE